MAKLTAYIRVSANKAEKAKIRFRLRDGRNMQLFYTSNLEIDPTRWDHNAEQTKARRNTLENKKYIVEDNDFNDAVKKVKTTILKVYFDEKNKEIKTSEWLQAEVNKILHPVEVVPVPVVFDFFMYFDKYIKDAPLSEGRKSHMEVTKKKIKKFDPDTTFEKINSQYLTDFQNHLNETVGRNTATSEMKRFRAFINYAISKNWATNYPFKNFSILPESYAEPVYITIEERDKLYNAEIDEERLSRVRDLFVFQCLIGCRVGDLIKLKKSNIINGSIHYVARKTKNEKPTVAVIPLTEKAKAILAKYNLENDDLLPYISDQKYNVYLREVFKHENVKLTRTVTIVDPKTRIGTPTPICDIASSHMARRVFVGSLFQKGVKDSIIASMSGHVAGSKAFNRYYKVKPEDQLTAINLIQ